MREHVRPARRAAGEWSDVLRIGSAKKPIFRRKNGADPALFRAGPPPTTSCRRSIGGTPVPRIPDVLEDFD